MRRNALVKIALIAGLALASIGLAASSVIAEPQSLALPVLLVTGVGAETSPDALLALGAVDANASPGAVLDEAIAAQRNGQNRAAAVFMLMALVGVVRLVWKTSQEKKWLGWLLNFATAYLATLGAVLSTGVNFSLSIILNAGVTALAAAGGWEAIKDSGILGLFTKKKE
jgi:hypothetical protein